MTGQGTNVPFGDLAWTDDATGIRGLARHGCRARAGAIVEYEEGASREEWCEEGHRGFVVGGGIEYEFDDGREPLRAEQGKPFSSRRRLWAAEPTAGATSPPGRRASS